MILYLRNNPRISFVQFSEYLGILCGYDKAEEIVDEVIRQLKEANRVNPNIILPTDM